MAKRICIREECGYWNNGCKECPDCKAPNTEVNDDCSNCLCCENIPNMLRWGDNSHWSKMRQLESQAGDELENELERANKIILEVKK